ncbi:hypothetical protein FGB62_6g226 [Gracilaria domingensis]|nr:hypothetical protein FGB62_6g226 [Gracilaria domingensis]
MLVPKMLHQIQVGDRQFMFRRYKRCFSGTDAVRFFLAKRYARNEHEAVAIGNALLKAGVFRHVRNEHLFRTGDYFYRFAAHEDYAVEDERVNLRSSRMMSVACNSYMRMPEISRVDTGPVMSSSNYSDATFFSYEDYSVTDDRPEFDETDIVVETGIRIGTRVFPNLVSNFTHAKDLIGTNANKGKILEKSFTGRSAVKWLQRHRYAKSNEEAISIGNAMLCSGVFYPLENDSESGFDSNLIHYRMMADTDISKELKRGARKDMFLRLLGVNRAKSGASVQQQQTPWFEDPISFSFTSTSSGGFR